MTIQNDIRTILLKKNKSDIYNIPLDYSIPSTLLIYDYLKMEQFKKSFVPILYYKNLNGYKFLDLKLLSKNKNKTSYYSNIFRDEDYHSEIILFSDNGFFDSEYMTDSEYNNFKNIYDNSNKYPEELFNLKKDDIIFDELNYNSLKLIIDFVNKTDSVNDLKSYILDNNLEDYYLILKDIFHLKDLQYLDKKNLFKPSENYITEIKSSINGFNLINSENFIQDIKNIYFNEYNYLKENITYIKDFINNTTNNFLYSKNEKTISCSILTKEELKKMIDNYKYKIGDFYDYLLYSDMSLFLDGYNNLKENDGSLIIVAKNKNNAFCGCLIAKNFNEYDNNDLYEKDIITIDSVSTNISYRGLNISSILYEKLIKYCQENNKILKRSMPTEDNKNYIYDKLEKITNNHNDSLLIINHNERSLYTHFSKFLIDNNLIKDKEKINKDVINIFKKFILKTKELNIYPDYEYSSFILNDQLKEFLSNESKKILNKNKKPKP